MTEETGTGKKYLHKKEFQVRYILYFLALLFCSGGILTYLLYHRSQQVLIRELYRGHSFTLSAWDILRPAIDQINISVSALVLAVAVIIIILVSWSVHRASEALVKNLRSARDTQDTKGWKKISHPREFGYLQSMLADGLQAHAGRIEAIKSAGSALEEKIRRFREEMPPEGPDKAGLDELRTDFESLRKSAGEFRLE
jgi:hypothetical protein